MLVSWLALSLKLKMEMICSSEMSGEFHQTTWCNIQDKVPLHGHIKSSTQVLFTCSFNDDL
jgi:hypothetical protein